MKKINTIKQINKMSAGEKVGRLLVFILGCFMASMSIVYGMPMFMAIIIIAGFLLMAMENHES